MQELPGNHLISQNNGSIRVRKFSLKFGCVRYVPLRLFCPDISIRSIAELLIHTIITKQKILRLCRKQRDLSCFKKTLRKRLGSE